MDEKFLLFAESLKLVRKADIEINNINVINEVYTDLLPNNGIMSKFNLPRTSVLIGRKGTGKSTIMQKSIYDISNDESKVGLYIDVKTLYDSATPSLIIGDEQIDVGNEIIKYLVYKNFLLEVIKKTKEAFSKTIHGMGFIKKTSHFISGDVTKVEKEFKKIEESIDNVYKNIDLSLSKSIKKSIETNKKSNDNASLAISTNPSLDIRTLNEMQNSFKAEFQSTMLRYLDIKKCLIDNFIIIRDILKVKYLYIYLDDYSEIDENAQELFMNWIIAPLNNLSENFIIFKIAAYPGRIYTGKMDNQKFDEINLDFFGALSTYRNIAKMENIAINYTRRLIQNRFKKYLRGCTIDDYFDIKEDELYEILFDVSLNIPRKLGYILSFCYESSLACGKKITKACIANAALRYYEEIILKYFESNKYVVRSFDDRVSIENQKELINKIINKEVENKSFIIKSEAKIFNIINPPTSHFLVNNKITKFLDTLELNGYISTYNKLNDKYNQPSTLYALDYGLCKKYNLNFGRPKDSKLRKYYNDYKFMFNDLVREHFDEVQIIICDKGHEFSIDMLPELEKFSMTCPECLKEKIFSICKVQISNRAFTENVLDYENNGINLDDYMEYELLNFLYESGSSKSFSAIQISQELDYSWQLIAKRAGKLIDKFLICLDTNKRPSDKRYYKICESTETILNTHKNIKIRFTE
ncbi:hypothetical protein JYG23_07685 [Sedimentibacter sp. zth1]|uniref:hypothetical protein n=1 Tax=Sedimentibacter sp. zth1 TaxID=2816908 RepID=UPI001A912F9E|nr:hypothetical protein [Sedimentibacter sp. zth1]QSX07214.1 hypothetical protein JYG23_07685 [Sedimentibacter sp. zth1]